MGNQLAEVGQQANLPELVQKWAAVGKDMDVIVAAAALPSTSSLTNFQRALTTALAIQHLRKMLNDTNMSPILALQGTAIGFRTDKDREGGYPLAVVRDCVIDAALRGASLVGNELNIIAERPYYTKEYYQRVTGHLPGVTDLEPSFGVPQIGDKVATVEVDCTWRIDGRQCRLAPGPGRDKGRVLSIRVNSGQGADQVLGKATRKLLKAVYEQITGSPAAPDGDAGDVIDVEFTSSPSAPPVGRTKVGSGNGSAPTPEPPPAAAEPAGPDVSSMPHGSECSLEWASIQKMAQAHGQAAIDDAKDECGYGNVPLEQCNAGQLRAVVEKVRDWVLGGRLASSTPKQADPVAAGGGKKKPARPDELNF